MSARRPVAPAAALLLLLLSATPAAAAPEYVSINVVDVPRTQDRWGFAPATRRIQPGTWVTWSNAGEDAHTITAVDGSFDSGDLYPSEGFAWFFDQPGTFEYDCALHPWMTGRIVVGSGSAPPAIDATAPLVDETPSSDAASN
jgi:plastocyanin